MAGRSQTPRGGSLPEEIDVDEEDIVRVVLEYLRRRGYIAAMRALEKQAETQAEILGGDAAFLRGLVLDGRWEDVMVLIEPLRPRSVVHDRACFEIRKQAFLEQLENNNGDKDDTRALVKALHKLERGSSTEEFNELCYLLTLPGVCSHPDFTSWTPHLGRLWCFESLRGYLGLIFPGQETPVKPTPRGQLELLCRQACMFQAEEVRQKNPGAEFPSSVIGGILSKSWAPKEPDSYGSGGGGGGGGGLAPLSSVAKISSTNKRRMPVLSPSSAALYRKEEGMGGSQNQSMGSLGWVLSCVSGDPWDGGGGRAGRRRSAGSESHEGILHPSSRHRHRSDSMDSEADFPGLNSPTGPKARRLSVPSSPSGAFLSRRSTSFAMDSVGGGGGRDAGNGGEGSLDGEKARERANNTIPARFKHLAPSWSKLNQLPSFGGSFSGGSSVGSSVGSRSGSDSESDCCETPRARKKGDGREEENNHSFQRGDPSVGEGGGVRRPLGSRPSASNGSTRAHPPKVSPMPGDVDKPAPAPIFTSPSNIDVGDTAPPHVAEEEATATTTTTPPMGRKSLAWGINLQSPLSASAAANKDACTARVSPVFGETTTAAGGELEGEEEEEEAGLSPLAYERACAEGGGGGRQPPGSHSISPSEGQSRRSSRVADSEHPQQQRAGEHQHQQHQRTFEKGAKTIDVPIAHKNDEEERTSLLLPVSAEEPGRGSNGHPSSSKPIGRGATVVAETEAAAAVAAGAAMARQESEREQSHRAAAMSGANGNAAAAPGDRKAFPGDVDSYAFDRLVGDEASTFVPTILVSGSHPFRSVGFSGDGGLFAVGCNDRALRVCKTPSEAELASDTSGMNSDSSQVQEWPSKEVVRRENHHLGSIFCLGFSPDSSLLATGSNDKLVKLLKLPETTTESQQQPGFGDIHDGDAEANNFVLRGHTGTVRDLCYPPPPPTFAGTPAASASSERLLSVGAGDYACRVWDVRASAAAAGGGGGIGPLVLLRGHTDTVFSCSMLPGGNVAVTGGADASVRLWDTRTGDSVRSLIVEGKEVLCVRPWPGDPERLVATAHSGGCIFLWDIRTGRALTSILHHTDQTRSLDFSQDGSSLLTASFDGLIGVCDCRPRGTQSTASLRLGNPPALGGASGAEDPEMDVRVMSMLRAHGGRVLQAKWKPRPAIGGGGGLGYGGRPAFLTSSTDCTVMLWTLSGGMGAAAGRGGDRVSPSYGASGSGVVV